MSEPSRGLEISIAESLTREERDRLAWILSQSCSLNDLTCLIRGDFNGASIVRMASSTIDPPIDILLAAKGYHRMPEIALRAIDDETSLFGLRAMKRSLTPRSKP